MGNNKKTYIFNPMEVIERYSTKEKVGRKDYFSETFVLSVLVTVMTWIMIEASFSSYTFEGVVCWWIAIAVVWLWGYVNIGEITMKRINDIGIPKISVLLLFVPALGNLFNLILCFMPSNYLSEGDFLGSVDMNIKTKKTDITEENDVEDIVKIKEWHILMKEGVITEEEFISKKREILGVKS